MRTYYEPHPLDYISSARRLYKFISFVRDMDDATIRTGKPWAHEKLNEAMDIRAAIYRSTTEANKNA